MSFNVLEINNNTGEINKNFIKKDRWSGCLRWSDSSLVIQEDNKR